MWYIVKKYIIEEYSIKADNRKDAIEKSIGIDNPYNVTVVKETIVLNKDNE
jgi:hypothetical protein